ncbi:hypothetical protein DdX_22334 [Ditylenchus destructor]|uniref:Uncharacterized protein n=1 Tax=Ditylenchus destructor TaxID=166010 RepID=A0AAD4MI43_9BILA|nr:hypothetical protein DdX_22334 [Ditylenchus destructor]
MAADSAFTSERLVAARLWPALLCRPLARGAQRRGTGGRRQLVGGRGAGDGKPRTGGWTDDPAATAAALLLVAADRYCGSRDLDPARRPALCGTRRAGCSGTLAATTVVEAVRDADLVRRRADRAGRRPVVAWPPQARTEECKAARGG